MSGEAFVSQIAPLVQKYAPEYGIRCCSGVIAQAILESGWGESKLASAYHNYFGLKCGTKWKGASVNLQTQEEYEAGTLTTITDNFRVFGSMEEGVKGYFEFLQLVLGCIEALSCELGLTLNAKKTHIVKLTHGFTFLKRKFSYGESGKVVVRPVRSSITRERRRLKKHARLVAEGRMTYEQACESYQSWRGSILKMDGHGAVLRMDVLFAELFGDRRSKISEDPPPATSIALRIIPFAKPLETRGVFFLPKTTERTE